MRIYLHIEPNNLADDEWTERWRELQWALNNGHPL